MLLSNPLGLTYRDAENQAHVAVTLAKKAGCPTSPLADMETCIRGLPTSTLLAAQLATETDFWDDLSQIDQLFLAWTPVLGTPEAPMKPMDAFTSGQWPSAGVPISINTVANEAVMFVWELSKKPLNSLLYNLLIDGIYPWHHAEIKQRYPLPANETADTRLHAASIVTPSLFRCAARHAARYMSQVSPVWVSEFDHIQSFAPAMWGPNYTECNTVVCHGSDLVEWFLPDVSSMGVQFTPAELALGHAMQHHMMNFGQPGRSGAWPEFNNATNTAAVLRTPAPEVVPNFDDDECNFWDSVGYNWY
jgi:carboxylesterase type B